MSNENPFAKALEESLGELNKAFSAADSALNETVIQASDALRNFTGGNIALALDMRGEAQSGVRYDLDLVNGGGEYIITIGAFRIPQTGFPILFGTNADKGFRSEGKLASREELQDYLIQQMRNPDSPLAVHVAYQMRKIQRELE